MLILFGTTCALPRGGKLSTCPLPQRGFHKLKTCGHRLNSFDLVRRAEHYWHPAMPIDEGGLPEHRSELYSRKTRHRVVFSWQTQFAGAALRILRSNLRRGRAPRTPKRTVFTKNTTSCRFFLANAVCWCCASHPAKQASGRAGSPNTEAHLGRLGGEGVPPSLAQSPSRP
jgi:hypothetical protein